MPIIISNPLPVTSVVKKLEWITLSLLLTALMEAGLGKRKYLVFNSDGSAAISMAITSVMKEFNITNYRHVICSQHIFRHVSAKLAKDEKVSSDKERRMKGRMFTRN